MRQAPQLKCGSLDGGIADREAETLMRFGFRCIRRPLHRGVGSREGGR